ncbi:MAG: hypothetical protein AAGD05_08000, partial [Bacteroidota bacterium]
MEKQKIDDFFKKKFEQRSFEMKEEHWAEAEKLIQQDRRQRGRWRRWFWLGLAFLITGGAMFLWFNPSTPSVIGEGHQIDAVEQTPEVAHTLDHQRETANSETTQTPANNPEQIEAKVSNSAPTSASSQHSISNENDNLNHTEEVVHTTPSTATNTAPPTHSNLNQIAPTSKTNFISTTPSTTRPKLASTDPTTSESDVFNQQNTVGATAKSTTTSSVDTANEVSESTEKETIASSADQSSSIIDTSQSGENKNQTPQIAKTNESSDVDSKNPKDSASSWAEAPQLTPQGFALISLPTLSSFIPRTNALDSLANLSDWHSLP